MSGLRVATYNIRLGGERGTVLDQAVRGLAADVLVVNESPKTPLLWRGRCRRLCARWGLTMAAGGRPAGGNLLAVAAGVRVVRTGALVLPQPFLAPRRGIAWAQLRRDGRPFGVVGCHLSLTAAGRTGEVRRVLEVADRLRGPVVVAGDLNEPPTGPAWRALRAAGFVDHGGPGWPTFPAERPHRRIDALLVRGQADVLHHGPPRLPGRLLAAASDHLPVVADLELG